MSILVYMIYLFPIVLLQSYTPNEYKSEELPDERVDTFGNCVCDLTFNQCDPNCCCDEDCSAVELYDYKNCVLNTSMDIKNVYCGDDSDVSGLFCVQYRMELLGTSEYFPEVQEITTEQEFSDRTDTSEFMSKYNEVSEEKESTSNYLFGDPIMAYMNSSLTNTITRTKFFIPSESTTSPNYVRQKIVTFGTSYQASKASFQANSEADFITYCEFYLDPRKYLEISILKDQITSTGVPVTFGAYPLNGGVTNGSNYYNSTSKECTQGVKKMTYRIYYDVVDLGRRSIENDDDDGFNSHVEINRVEVVVNSLQTKAYTQGTALQVEYEVLIIRNGAAMWVNSTTVDSKSGNPGYVRGKPLIVGRSVSQTKIIDKEEIKRTSVARRKYGLEVYTGICSNEDTVSIEFGVDAEYNCKISLTPAELGDLCLYGSAGNINETITFDVVGKFGNPDTAYITDWVKILNHYTQNVGIRVYTNGKCTGMMNSITYEFLTTRSGDITNPQWKIYGVKRTLDAVEWRHTGVATSEDFFVRWKAVFLENPSQEYSQLTVGTGINLQPLPANALAPFELGDSSDDTSTTSS